MDDAPAPSRDDVVALVQKAHHGAPYAECKVAGAALADQSKLPRLIAENLGAGFGQWTFFPEAAAIVDFAFAYAPPANPEEMWTLARQWADDDAASRHTVLALIGRELLDVELRRVDVPELRSLMSARGGEALALRKSLGLAVPSEDAPKAKPVLPTADADAPASTPAPAQKAKPKPARRAPITGVVPMPKPTITRPKPEPPPPPPRTFTHPKFGAGVLERIDGAGDDAKITIRFEGGTKTLLAKFVTEVVS